METLRIRAATPQTGRAMLAALSDFRAELLESSEGCEVLVKLGRDDEEIIGVLNALERYVTDRADGPARVEVFGKSYVLHPAEHLNSSWESDLTTPVPIEEQRDSWKG
jgi:hypothetical protein